MSSPPGSGPTNTSSPLAPSLTGIIPDLTSVGYTNSQLLNFWKEISDLIISVQLHFWLSNSILQRRTFC